MESISATSPANLPGRSRFSKALPSIPNHTKSSESPVSSKYLRSPLPILPKHTMPSMSIARRPVGGSQTSHTRPPSASSSIYSDTPELSRTESDASTKTSSSGVQSEDGRVPPLPPKDSQRQQQQEGPTTPKILSNSPPPRPEIWRRRSVSATFPELKLQKSNGSTASPPSQLPWSDHSLPPNPRPPRSAGRKPVPLPTRPAPPQPQVESIVSKLKSKYETERSTTTEEYDPFREKPEPQTYTPPFNRLPTPDYQKSDKQQPMTPMVLSTVSPETPPREEPPAVPRKSESRGGLATNILDQSSKPNLLNTHSREVSETLTITTEPVVMRSPQPQKAYAAARILTPSPSLGERSPLPTPPPADLEINFPTIPSPAPPGTIFSGPALAQVHLDCYQAHKFMRSSRNTLCPVACMICEKKDTEMRWNCSWCCLRCCSDCMHVLASIPGKDLRLCLEKMEEKIATVS